MLNSVSVPDKRGNEGAHLDSSGSYSVNDDSSFVHFTGTVDCPGISTDDSRLR